VRQSVCQTPHIDRLAARGMHFLSAYAAAPQCSPTRASILTGKYPGRLGLTLAVGDEPAERVTGYLPDNAPSDSVRIEPVSANRLVLEHVTLAEAFKSAGYATAHYGKWHVGWAPYGPRAQGFDQALPNGSHTGPPS
jgi:arylsulfatase A-like enzyme